MTLSFWFFIVFGGLVAAIDAKKEIVPDVLVLPSIIALATLKYFEGDILNPLLTAAAAAIFFITLLYFFDDFGGGDIRFVGFCAIFLGFPNIFIFFIFAGVLHIVALKLLTKQTAGFAPAMYLAAIVADIFGDSIWSAI